MLTVLVEFITFIWLVLLIILNETQARYSEHGVHHELHWVGFETSFTQPKKSDVCLNDSKIIVNIPFPVYLITVE